MAEVNLQKELDKIHTLTVGDGTTKGDRRVIRALRRILNRAETQVTVDSTTFSTDLEKQYRQRTGKSPSAKVMEGYDNLGKDVVRGWRAVVKGREDMSLLPPKSSATKVVFVIKEKQNTTKKGTQTMRDNYSLFQRENQKIVQPLIKAKYHHLFRGRTRTKKGHVRAIGDVGHDFSVTAKGRAGVGAGMLDNLLAGDFKNPDDRDRIQSMRDGFTNVGLKANEVLTIKGKGRTLRSVTKINLTLESDTANREKAAEDKKEGDKVREYIKDAIEKSTGKFSSADKYFNAEGSTPLIDQVGEAIVNTPLKLTLYKKKKARNLSKYKKVIANTTKTKNAKTNTALKSKKQHITGGGVDSTMIAAITKTERSEKGPKQGNEDFAQKIKGLLKVKRAINARLPAEVRRNMGSASTLNNRTGRFSNSAEVTQILPAAQTLMVKYSYRLDPYETFENRGKRRWPAGYNPKPLIAKSIRGLALGLVDEKLTIRRE